MRKVISCEPQVNSTMEYFLKRLDIIFADKYQVFNLALCLQAFAFYVISNISFSKRTGLLEKVISTVLWYHYRQTLQKLPQ